MSSTDKNEDVHCQFYVLKKKRYCKMTVKEGQIYCGQHKPTEDTARVTPPTTKNAKKTTRVPCPYDNKHTCYVEQLEKHLSKCNSKPLESLPPHIILGINLPQSLNECVKTMADVSDAELMQLIQKIKSVAQECPKVSEGILENSAVMEELQKPEYGPNKRKHLIQNSSLLGHMEKSGLLKNKTCFIEFGAGRGQLSYWLGKAMENNSESMILLIDKASHRHKYDNRQEFNMQRIRADIADLDITQIEHIHKYEQVVAVSKHLCGAATDMALHCVVNGSSRKLGTSLNVTGIIMAFCCHHRCNWDTYTGKQFLEEKGFTSADFRIMRGIVSWATCGSGRSRDWDGNLSEEKDYSDHQNQTDTTRYLQLNLDQGMRKSIGRQCKLILDYGRLKFLERHGFATDLVHYIHEDVSPENLCIIALKKSNKVN